MLSSLWIQQSQPQGSDQHRKKPLAHVMQVTVQQHVCNIITTLKGGDSWAHTLCMHGGSGVDRIQVLFGGQA